VKRAISDIRCEKIILNRKNSRREITKIDKNELSDGGIIFFSRLFSGFAAR